MSPSKAEYYRQFLAGMILVGLAGTGTLWWVIGWPLALAYSAGFSTPLVFSKAAPTHQPDVDQQAVEEDRGYR